MIGVIDHHTLQIERPDEVAALIREALKHIPPERLIISSDCGMGREGMGRRHAGLQDGVDGARAPISCARSWDCRKRNAWPPTPAIR